jgi:hypothetical protein
MRGCLVFVAVFAMCASAHAKTFTVRQAPTALIELAPASLPTLVAVNAPLAPAFPIEPPTILRMAQRLQCAVYARMRAGIEIRGAAGSWWGQAQGRYKRADAPQLGAVMVLGGTPKGHVAVVAQVLSPTEILVDHANWMNKGEVEIGALVRDVSAANDWSAVRVWYPPTRGLGNKAYPVRGFILPGAQVQVASLN